MEIWKKVKDYENLYEISNTGKIKSLRFNKENILKIRFHIWIRLTQLNAKTNFWFELISSIIIWLNILKTKSFIKTVVFY